MQSTSWETLGWKKYKLKSRLVGEISITSDMQMTPPLCQKVKRNSKAFDESESGEWKSWLKAQHSENEDHGIWSHYFMANRWGNSANCFYFISSAPISFSLCFSVSPSVFLLLFLSFLKPLSIIVENTIYKIYILQNLQIWAS